MEKITLDQIRKMPKVELHRHVDGAVDPWLVWHLAKEEGIELPQKTSQALAEYLRIRKGMTVKEIMAKFDLVVSVMQSWKNISCVFYNQIIQLARENIVYAELRFAPQLHTKKGLTLEQVIRAALHGMRLGMKECRTNPNLPAVEAKLILCIARDRNTLQGRQVAQTGVFLQDAGVVAIDLACNEDGYPPELHLAAYQDTFNSRLGRTAHAGEFGSEPARNIRACLRTLRCSRIAHARELTQHDDLLRYCAHNKIHIEICPISNLTCGVVNKLEDLCLDKLQETGVSFSINSDDPALFGASLSFNLFITADVFSWSAKEIVELNKNALQNAFIRQEDKDRLVRKWF